METTENNRLIAEFMEFKQCKGIRSESGKYFDYWAKENFSCIEEQEIEIESELGFGLVEQDLLFAEQLKFHSDWNWLMLVVNKVESLGNEVLINTNYIQISFDEGEQFVVIEEVNVKIQGVYLALVEFIKLYNQNK